MAPFSQPGWGPRGVWASHANGLAFLQRGDSAITIREEGRRALLQVTWPREDVRVGHAEKTRLARWIFARDSARAPADRPPRSEAYKRCWTDDIPKLMPISDVGPEVTRLSFPRDCPLLAPFDPDANIDGVGDRVLVIHLTALFPLGVVSLPTQGSRTRTSGRGAVWVTYLDHLNALVLERLPLPFPVCR
jgi:hypothetical protein